MEKLRDKSANTGLFLHIDTPGYVVDRWRIDYNHYRPHSLLGYMSPATFTGTRCGTNWGQTHCF
ncbi:MAG: integrase core domain-containing protein [Planctomycetota bacterium]